jgi:hypothetical protein
MSTECKEGNPKLGLVKTFEEATGQMRPDWANRKPMFLTDELCFE